MKNAIILCSGGVDSITTAHYVKKRLDYKTIKIIFFDYGQRNLIGEERCARKCAKNLKADFIKSKLGNLERISTSLLNSKKKAKNLKKEDLKNTKEESNKWYVPCRNAIFLINSLSLAESLFIGDKKKFDIFVGFKCEGKESYPDTTKDFVEVMNKLSEIGCSSKFRIIAPLINKDKEDIVNLAKKLKIDLKNTFSCYVGPKIHCGTCLACLLRKEGFYWANVKDPTEYRN